MNIADFKAIDELARQHGWWLDTVDTQVSGNLRVCPSAAAAWNVFIEPGYVGCGLIMRFLAPVDSSGVTAEVAQAFARDFPETLLEQYAVQSVGMKAGTRGSAHVAVLAVAAQEFTPRT